MPGRRKATRRRRRERFGGTFYLRDWLSSAEPWSAAKATSGRQRRRYGKNDAGTRTSRAASYHTIWDGGRRGRVDRDVERRHPRRHPHKIARRFGTMANRESAFIEITPEVLLK